MKKFLKAIVSIAIVVGLIWGVSYLVSNNKGGENLYNKLETKQTSNSVRKEPSENGLESLITYIKDNQNKFDDTVVQSVAENGSLSILRTIYASCDQNFDYFKDMLVLVQGNNQNSILSNYDKLVEQINIHQQSLKSATKITQNASGFNKIDFKFAFNTFLNDYSKSVEIYSSLCNEMSQFILKNAFDGFTTNYDFIIYTICAKTNLFACENHNLLSQNKLMQEKCAYYLTTKDYGVVNAFLQIDDIDDFIKSEDKAQFIENKTDKSPYQTLNNFFREV